MASRNDPDGSGASETVSGRFERSESAFRRRIAADGPHPPAPDRYHLYVSRACPWAHRTMVVRALKGLEAVVSADIVDPIRFEAGWRFSPDKPDCSRDRVNGADHLREIYHAADPDYAGRVTVPVLWDREAATIVNNESREIIRFLDEAFDAYATRDVTLYPDDLPVAETIDEIYTPINNGVYRAGFAGSQAAYDEAVEALFDALDRWEDVLGEQRYVCGDRLTAADVCLFTTLYRFDEVYHTHFKCNRRRLVDYPNLWGHTREIYQLPGVAATCNMAHCREHYYRTHPGINPTGIVPIGPDPDFERPHDRDRLAGGPPQALAGAD